MLCWVTNIRPSADGSGLMCPVQGSSQQECGRCEYRREYRCRRHFRKDVPEGFRKGQNVSEN